MTTPFFSLSLSGGVGRRGGAFSLFGGRKKPSVGRKGAGVSLAHLVHPTSLSADGAAGIHLSGPELVISGGERRTSESSLSSSECVIPVGVSFPVSCLEPGSHVSVCSSPSNTTVEAPDDKPVAVMGVKIRIWFFI